MEDKKNNGSQSSGNKNPATRKNGTGPKYEPGKRSVNYKGGSSSGDKSQNRKSKVAVKEKDSNHKEIIALIIIAFCVLVIVSLFNQAGIVGGLISGLLFGFFGGFGTIVAVLVMLVYSVCILRGNEKTVFNLKRCLLLTAMFLCGSALLHTVSGLYMEYVEGETNFFKLCAYLWTSVDKHFLGGGLVGGGLSTLLQATVAQVGTYVILIPATLIFAMLIFSFSILPFVRRVEKVAQKSWGGVVGISRRLKDKSHDSKEKARSKKVEKKTKTDDHEIVVSGGEDYYIDDETGEIIAIDGPAADENDFLDIDFPIDEDSGFDITYSAGASEEGAEGAKNTASGSSKTLTENISEKPLVFEDEFEEIPLEGSLKKGEASLGEKSDACESGGSNPEEKGADGDDVPTEETVAEEIAKIKKTPFDSVDMPVLSKGEYADYVYPADDLLNIETGGKRSPVAERAAATAVAKKLEEVLKSFTIEAKVTHVSIGPSVTRYELLPSTGVRVNRIKNLSDDIALNLAAQSIRIEAPIPGKAAIGIEIPNKETRAVYLREIIQSAAFKNNKSNLTFCLGSDISGTPIAVDLEKMPHMMIAGTTGSGKSVCTNCLITSLLYKSSPDEVRLILVDPKIVEFSKYNGIPHLLLPVVTEPKKAAAALAWAVSEMEKRYRLFAAYGVRDIASYNVYAEKNDCDKMPRIVILIDELADLMMVARDSVETAINRIAQKARAAGMHLVIATQRPSVDVITGLIKSNVPSRIALKVASPVDSRIILDSTGAEKLLGRGDMLFYPVGSMKTTRIQGAFVSDEEIERVVEFIKGNGENEEGYIEEIIQSVNNAAASAENGITIGGAGGGDDEDALFKEAVKIAIQEKQISASYLQRMLKIGFNRAARMIDLMEEKGIISCRDGNNPRKVLVDHYDGVS